MGEITDDEGAKLSCCQRCTIRWNNFKKEAWNKETRTSFGKSGTDWGKSFLSYALFYGIFAVFYTICFAVLDRTLGNEAPSLIYMNSPIKINPALNFEPKPNKNSNLIKLINLEFAKTYEDQITQTYSGYQNTNMSDHTNCSIDSPIARAGKPCLFNITSLGNACSPSNKFGYREFKPCVMLRINKVFGWNPLTSNFDCDSNNSTTICQTFNAIPSRLKTKLKKGNIAFSCEGQNTGDNDNILDINFYPKDGIPSYYYPFYNQPGFQSPVIMVKFHTVPGTLVMVWCRLWTDTIKHDITDQQGSVKFEILASPNVTFSGNIWK